MLALHPLALQKSLHRTFFTGSVKSYGGGLCAPFLVLRWGCFNLFARCRPLRHSRYGGRAANFTVRPIYGGAQSKDKKELLVPRTNKNYAVQNQKIRLVHFTHGTEKVPSVRSLHRIFCFLLPPFLLFFRCACRNLDETPFFFVCRSQKHGLVTVKCFYTTLHSK